jgi:hypothetical protein
MGFPTRKLYAHFKPKRVRYVHSVVSYLDILGFRELIETRKAGEISRILRILAESVKPEPEFRSDKIKFTKFSDTVIRSMPAAKYYPHNFIFELRSLLNAQIALLSEGILIRGAVTIGEIVQSWGIVYGPAVVRAYTLERQKDSPPRITVDEEALALIRPAIEEVLLGSELAALLREDGSTTYLDYLRACCLKFIVPEQEYPLFLKIHRDLIRTGLTKYAATPSVLKKYEWLKEYHDHTIDEQFGTDASRHLLV